MKDHLHDGSAPIEVLVADPDDRVDNQSGTIQLQRLEIFDSLIGRFDPAPAMGFIVVQHHGVDAKFNKIGMYYMKPTNKQMLQQRPAKKDPRPGECIVKTLDPVGGGHLAHGRLNTGRISRCLWPDGRNSSQGFSCH